MHLEKDRDTPSLDLWESRSNAGLVDQERPPTEAADFFVAWRRIMADMIRSFVTTLVRSFAIVANHQRIE